MGIRGSRGGDGLGRYVSLHECTIDASTKNKLKPTRTMKISEMTYRRLTGLSNRAGLNAPSYEELINFLLDEYQSK